jgi:hypothetical protein
VGWCSAAAEHFEESKMDAAVDDRAGRERALVNY